MEGLLAEIAKQVPALLVLGWIVWKFLTFIQSQASDFTKVIDKINERNVKAIDENTQVHSKVLEHLRNSSGS